MDQVQGVAKDGQFARICVFCGSSSGKKAIYTQVAEELGIELVKRGINLVYGGGSIGLMGTVAQAAHTAGGHVVGVIPKALMPKEICGSTVGELVAVDDMHQRKAEMARRADAFIALPGGYGTFEEVLEIITWAQLGIHKKPVGLLNVDGYYDAILTLFNKALDEGFLNLASHNIVVSAPTAAELLDKLKNYKPTEDKSVPQLTWDSVTQEPASNFAAVMVTTGANAAVHDPVLHLAGRSSTTMGPFNTGVTHTGIRMSDGRPQPLPLFSRGTGRVSTFQTSALARSGRFSVHSYPKFGARGRRTATAIGAYSGHEAALGARVITPLIL